jgi:hypothetical protein
MEAANDGASLLAEFVEPDDLTDPDVVIVRVGIADAALAGHVWVDRMTRLVLCVHAVSFCVDIGVGN